MSRTADQLVLVHCHRLEPGMFVGELDRSWLHTPFDQRGFMITQPAQVETLQRYCDYVYVDPARSDPSVVTDFDLPAATHPGHNGGHAVATTSALHHARAALRDANDLVGDTIRTARRDRRIEIVSLYRRTDAFLDAALQDPESLQWLIATEPKQRFINRRALGTSLLCILFGRHLGLERHELLNLALGGLLLDIGKVAVPVTILAKPARLSPEEQWFTNRHVDQGLAMIDFNGRMLERVAAMIGSHHERLDGSGYPERLAGTEIPIYARIAGIADTFDALTLNRRYAAARSGHAAVRFLVALRGTKFDAALVDEFITRIGMYPTGTRVRLGDGATGFVCGQNPGLPWRPSVMLTDDARGQPLKTLRVLDVGPHAPIVEALPAAD